MRYNLRTGTLAIFIVLFLLVLLAETAYFYPGLKKDHLKEGQRTQAQLADQITADLELFLKNARHELESLAQILENDPLTKDRLDRVLVQANKTSPFFKTFYVVDRAGTWVSFPQKPHFVGRKLPPDSMAWIKGAFKKDAALSLDVNRSKVGTLVTGFVVPLQEPGSRKAQLLLRGVIVLSEENSMLSAVRKTKVGENGYAYIVSRKGQLMAHPDIIPDFDNPENDYSGYGPVGMLLAGGEGIFDYEYQGRTWIAATRRVEPMGWGVVVQQPREDIMGYARLMMNRLFLFSFVAFILSIPALSFAVHFSMRPLTQLMEKIRAKQMVPGELFTKDEVGKIAREFNLLYTDLANSEEQLRRLINRVEHIREEERRHISREVHDDLGQKLTALNMDLSWLARRVPQEEEQVHEKIADISGLVSETIHTTQQLCGRLRPPLLDALGLVPAAEREIADFKAKHSIRCDTMLDIDEKALPPDVSLALFRVLQEALTNIARHAQATRVAVSLYEQDGHARLCIRDNGIGITEEQLSNRTALGLLGIRERISLMHGELSVRSEQGTTLEVSVPLKGSAEAYKSN